mgnify:CR=1 FL=1
MNNQDYYNKEYVPQVNKIGKITGYLGAVSYTHLTLPTIA